MIIEMTRDEFQTVLDESLSAFREEVKAEITKATTPAPPAGDGGEGEGETVAKADLEALGADILSKVEAAMVPVTETMDGFSEVIDAVLDRVEGLAKRAVIKRSIDAQDGEGDGNEKPTLKSAMVAALQGRKVECV